MDPPPPSPVTAWIRASTRARSWRSTRSWGSRRCACRARPSLRHFRRMAPHPGRAARRRLRPRATLRDGCVTSRAPPWQANSPAAMMPSRLARRGATMQDAVIEPAHAPTAPPEPEAPRTPPAAGLSDSSFDPAAEPPVPPSSDAYLNRELTWLNFAWRVVQEAVDDKNPLLERVKFLAIVGSTLDEFFMKRIGGLKSQVGAGVGERSVDGRTPSEQIRGCYALIRELERHMADVLGDLRQRLVAHRIEIVQYAALTSEERRRLREYYSGNIFPLVTPQAKDPAHPFPFV